MKLRLIEEYDVTDGITLWWTEKRTAGVWLAVSDSMSASRAIAHEKWERIKANRGVMKRKLILEEATL